MKTYTMYLVSHEYGFDLFNWNQLVEYCKEWWEDFQTDHLDGLEWEDCESDREIVDAYFYDNYKEWSTEVTFTDEDLIAN